MAPLQNDTGRERDRRPLPRVRADATACIPGEDALELIDLSHAGCAAESRVAFQPGDEMHLTFTVDTCLSFIVPVRVMYARRAMLDRSSGLPYLVGFSYLSAGHPEIHRVIEILLAAEAPLAVH
jgi:hypothetical protein